jgi:arylsulfatase A-like enzyme
LEKKDFMETFNKKNKPNIILIVMDSLRYDLVSGKDGSTSLTPNIDRWITQGVNFTQAIAQGPSTRVSMSSLMSSTYASMYGGSLKLSKERPVIQQMLHTSGYTTIGVTANLYLSRNFGWERGFDYYDDCRPESIYRRKLRLRLTNQIGKRIGYPLAWPKSLPAELVFENTNRILKNISEPFFMWVHLMDTHWPYSIQKFSWGTEWKKQRVSDEMIRPRLISEPPHLTQEETKILYEQYRRSVAYTDMHLGAFLDNLKGRGLLEDSWVVLTADHGEEFLEHGRFFHHPTPFDELAHVPLVIIPPGHMAGYDNKTVDNQVRLIDLVPTFLDISKTKVQDDDAIQGKSLKPMIFNGSTPDDRPAITESPHNQALSIRMEGWKYIWEIWKERRMLFNLNQDPLEQENLIEQESDISQNLHNLLVEHLNHVNEGSLMEEGDHDNDLNQEMIERLRDLGYVE